MLKRFLSLEVVVSVSDRLESSTIPVGGWIDFLCYCPRSLMGIVWKLENNKNVVNGVKVTK